MPLYAFNGTWNTFYLNGVGTRLGWFGKVFGGAFGAGGYTRLAEALDHLRAARRTGDPHIDIVGFSRGAERRQTFRVTRVTGAYEVWFRGSHSDVGGGNGNHGLNAVGAWMLRKARACGLPIGEDHILDAAAAAKPASAPMWAGFDPVRNAARSAVVQE